MDRFLAHRSEDGREQTVEEHLYAVSSICGEFAKAFGAEPQGRMIGLAHDIGKCSKEFQQRLLGGRIVDHASAGALECGKLGALWAASCIAGHHGGLADFGNPRIDQPDDATLIGRMKRAMKGGIPKYEMLVSLPSVAPSPEFGTDGLADSFWIRMLYSCLVDADYLDTERFMSGDGAARRAYDPLPRLLEKLEQYILPWQNPSNALNQRRCEVLKACMDGGEGEKGFYTLTVPTGGGKTVASMAFALRHAVKHGMDRVIYVIPYTSIIEQTADVFRGIFGDENVLEYHSGVSYEVEEGAGAEQYRFAGSTENWDAPIVVTTAVQFFESLYANRPAKCRKLHNIANSVIIFDEAQMLPTEHLRPCVAAIGTLVSHFCASAVLCTATQPVLNDLFQQYVPRFAIKELAPDVPGLFRQLRRVTVEHAGVLDADALAERLSAHRQVLCIVNSRRSAQDVYKKLPQDGSFHLSTLMYPMHRRAVLARIRKRLMEGLPCRVVSTSLIEAGVDVDFPAVYREMAGLDSILQAAGRCNREGKRRAEDSVVTVFEGLSVVPQMLKVNIGAAKEALKNGADPSEPRTVESYFRFYRSFAEKKLDKAEVVSAFQEGISGCILPFKTVAQRFRLIDDASKTVYIPRDEGEELVQRLREGERSRGLFRKLGQYGVSVYERQYQVLLSSGYLESIDEDSGILLDNGIYARDVGLTLLDDANTKVFLLI